MSEKLIFPIGFDLEEGVAQVEKDWGKMQKKLQDTFKSQTIQVDADISKAVLDKLYAKFEGLIKTMESKAPQIKLKIPDTVDFEQEINRLKVQLKSINLGELTDAESKDLYLYIRQLEALAKALKEVNKQEQLRQANRPEVIALRQAQAEEKRTRAIANSALAEQRRAKIATESARQAEINNRSAQRSAVIAEQKRAATARAEQAELRLTRAKERSTQATHEQNSAYKTQGGYLSRLFQRMVAYASVAQAFSFVRNVRDVTAEFELQRVALGSIIGDLNEANAMFEQIKAAAVKSPFQIKELVTYTKQLAAYKIESDELFETTQKLADVSAGLGVGMERLVLAYGQIRATGYLRASEVRQLTEAGIPIVEELAKKMSQLRGETVSAAEVMGMISERAISFGMVKEVFDDMTSAGGMFYKMQEKQAETLRGQWNNLKDSIAIMYDEIGNTEVVNNSIKGTIGLVKSLAENWRVVGDVAVWSVGSAMGYAKVIKPISELVKKQDLLKKSSEAYTKSREALHLFMQTGDKDYQREYQWQLRIARSYRQSANAAKGFGGALKSIGTFIKGNIWGILLTALATIVAYFISARKEAKRLNEELAKIGTEGALQADQSVRNFERLAKTIRESADGSREQSEALAELKRTYGDLLPTQDKEILALVKVKEGYEDVTTAIREKINAQIYEQKMNTIISEYGEDLANKQKKPKKWLENMGFSVEETTRIFNAIDKAVQEGLIKVEDDVVTQARKIEKIIKDQTGKVTNLTESQYARVAGTNQTIYTGEKATRLAKKLSDLVGVYSDFNNSVNELSDSQKRASNITWEYQKGYDGLKDSIAKTNAKFNESTFAGSELIKANTLAKWREYFISLSDIFAKTPEGGIIDFTALEDEIEKLPANLRAHIRVVQKEYEKLIPTDITRLANDKLKEYADKVGISMDDIKEHLKTNEQSTEDWAKGLKGAYESLEKKLAEYKLNRDNAISIGKKSHWSKEVEKVEDEMKVLKFLMEYFKEFLKGGDTKQRKSQLSILQEELQLHEKIYAKYKEYRQYMSAEEAKAKVEDYFGDTIDALKFKPSFDKSGYQSVLEQYKKEANALLAKAKDETEKASIKKFLLDIGFKIGDKDWEETKDNMEKNLKKLSDDLSRTKTAKEFFDRMLGMTGDKELSATLTLSVYGTTGDDLKSALVKQVQGAFEGQDLSKAINTDLNSIDLSALREIYNKLPEDFQEKQKQSMKQVLDMLEKGQNDLANNFAKLLMDYDEMEQKRVTITQKATQEIATLEQGLQAQIEGIRQNKEIADKDSAIADATARAEAVRKAILAREKLELSKLSPEYIRFFSSINAMAMETANSTRTQLRRALFDAFEQGGISAEELRKELKAIDTQFNKLNENATLFSSYATGGFDAWLQKLQQSADELDAIAARMMKLESIDQMDEGDKNFINKMLRVFGDKGQKSLSDLATSFNNDMSQMGDAVQKVGGQMQSMFSSATGAISIVDAIIKGVGQTIDGVGQVIGQINSMRSEDNQIGGWFKYIQDFNKYAQAGWEDLKSGNIAGALANTVSSIISIFQNIQADKIKKLDDEIERQQELLDNLSYSYDRLQKSAERAFGTEYIQNYQRQLTNLEAQVEAYEKQLDAERSKGKKADEDKIKEYGNQIRDTKDAIEDMYGSLSEHFLGTDLTSAARDFASAWIDAYKEFANTTDAMKEKFHDMIQNMIVESLIAKVMERALEPVFTMVDNMGDSDFYSNSFWSQLMTEMNKATEKGVVGAQNIMGMLESIGINSRDTGTGLTGISRDIASASEESILGLAAGINTQNFYISQVPTKLDTIIGLLRGGSAVVDSGVNVQDLITIQNQHLSYLPTIAQNTAETVARCERAAVACESMASKLGSVIKPKGTTSTHSVNVTIGS